MPFDKNLGQFLLHKHKASEVTGLDDVATSGDHTDLSNIGTNTHAQIDTHIADSTIHYPQSSIAIPASQITDFDTEVSNNTDVSANTTARHTHANKALLDTYTQTEANLADAVAKKHDAATAGAGISISGQEITNSDRGSTAVGTHESTYTHTDIALNTSARHDAVTIGTNTATALSLSGQQISIGDVFVRNTGDTITGDLIMSGGGIYSGGSGDDIKVSTTAYVKSRGMNLVTNGFGLMRNNYNFGSETFEQDELYAGFGSFKSTARTIVATDEFIPIDPNLYYKGSAWLKTTNLATSNKGYGGIECNDADGLLIAPYFTMIHPGSTQTTLAADLNNGDTTMQLTDATGWYTGATSYLRQALFFGYQNSFGYTYPDYTYSRFSTYYLPYTNPVDYRTAGFWSTSGISGNTITLTTAWPGDTIPAGTAVQNGSSGGSYKYTFGQNITIPEDWTQLTGIIGSVDTTGLNNPYKFHPGTAFIRLIFLTNYPTEDANEMNISAIYFSEVNQQNLISTDTEYTSAGNLDLFYTYHRCNSASAFSLYVPDSFYEYQKLYIRNVNTGTVTLTGNFASTVTTSLTAGSKVELYWSDANGQWE